MSQDKLVLIRQALAAAESSIKTAKQLLSEVESGGLHISAKDLPGEAGVFDGVGMVTEGGEKLEVPANYASKSMLVVGDTLKLVDENGEKRFKQVEHVKRHKTTGILHRKDGKFKVITPEGSYNVLGAAVEHFKGDVGDEVVLHLPAGNLTAAYGAIERIAKSGEGVAAEKTEEVAVPSQPAPAVEVEKEPEASVVVSEPEVAATPVSSSKGEVKQETTNRSEGSARPKSKKRKPIGKRPEGSSRPAPRPSPVVPQVAVAPSSQPKPEEPSAPVASWPELGDDELR